MKETKFKQTEIGEIPEDWEVVCLNDTCDINPSFVGNKPDEFIYIDLESVENGVLLKKQVIHRNNAPSRAQRQIRINDILYQTVRPYQRNNLYVDFECSNYIASTGYAVLRASENVSNGKFLYYVLLTDKFVNQVLDKCTGTSYPAINPSSLSETQFAIPPTVEEQERIAEALSDVDGLLRELDAEIAKKRVIKQGAMQELLTGKRRLEGFGGEWEEKKLGEMLKYEQPTPFIVSSTEYDENGVPVLTAGKTFILGYTNEDYGVYQDVPIILFDDFTTASKYVDFPFKVKSSAAKILSLRSDENNLRLIYELMQLIDFPLKDHQRYWISEYSKLVVKIPTTIEEQTAIAKILSDMDADIEALEAKRAKYAAVKQGMMQELLTGRIRLI